LTVSPVWVSQDRGDAEKEDEPGGEPEEGAADHAEERMGSEGQVQGVQAPYRFFEVGK